MKFFFVFFFFLGSILELEAKECKNIDGVALANHLKEDLLIRIEILNNKYNITPCLAIIQVGNNMASTAYISSKKRKCEEVGIIFLEYNLKDEVDEKIIIDLINELNHDEKIHGLIVQLPLPKKFNQSYILQNISPQKDVDGLHPLNLGKVFSDVKGGFIPCTARGCISLIHSVEKNIIGLNAVIIGASNLVGKPLAHLLLKEGATVSLLNSKTRNPEVLCSQADILISAAGIPFLVNKNWVKEGVIIVDVGINHLLNKDGNHYLVGDVDYKSVYEKAKAISPVPGGVGPMTVVSLLENTVLSAEKGISTPIR